MSAIATMFESEANQKKRLLALKKLEDAQRLALNRGFFGRIEVSLDVDEGTIKMVTVRVESKHK